MGVRDDVAVRGYDEAGAQRLRFTGLRLSRKAKQAAERRSGEGILDLNMLAGGNIDHCGLKPFNHVGKTGRRASGGYCLHRRTFILRSEEHTSELQSLMRISYAVFCFKKKTAEHTKTTRTS